MNVEPNISRRGGRDARRVLRTTPKFQMLPTLRRGLPNVEPMDEEQVEKIHAASMDILEEVGVVFRDPIALEDWKRVGADVRGERVYLDRALVMDLIKTIPSEIRYHARNPDNGHIRDTHRRLDRCGDGCPAADTRWLEASSNRPPVSHKLLGCPPCHRTGGTGLRPTSGSRTHTRDADALRKGRRAWPGSPGVHAA